MDIRIPMSNDISHHPVSHLKSVRSNSKDPIDMDVVLLDPGSILQISATGRLSKSESELLPRLDDMRLTCSARP